MPARIRARAVAQFAPDTNGLIGQNLSITYRPVADLMPALRNARTHSKKQIQQLAASIRQFGFINPVLTDATGGIVAGHGRIEAAKLLGQEHVPTIRLDHLSEAERRAYIIADNRLAELAGWDKDLLAVELGELANLEINFDIEITGFDTLDIEKMTSIGETTCPTEDQTPGLPSVPVSRLGDLWLLGPHRLLCGDARDPEAFVRLMDGGEAQMAFSDPPYNVRIDGHVCGLGKIRHREFAMASGEMNDAEFTAFLTSVFGNMAAVSADGAIHFLCMDWRHMREMLSAGASTYSELKNLCVWNKDNAGMGSFYRSKHELVFVFKHGTAPHINTFGLGEGGRYRTNVWNYPGVNSLHPGRDEDLAMHPTVKPIAMVIDAIKDCSHRNGIILDAFGGSGTTLIAAHKTRRRGHLLELDPAYVDVTIQRWEKLSGETARHAETGATFAETAAERACTEEECHG